MLIAHAALGLSMLFTASVPEKAPAPTRRLALHLEWFDGNRLLPLGFAQMSHELRSIFSPLGVDIRWTPGGGPPPPAVPGELELRVLLLPNDPSSWGLGQDVLGAVMGKDVPRGVVYLFFNNIVRTLGFSSRPETLLYPKEGTHLARAVARVLAHEMVHAIAPDEPHRAQGLMSCQLKRVNLIRSRVELDAETAHAFRAELSRLVLADDRVPAPGLAQTRPGLLAEGKP